MSDISKTAEQRRKFVEELPEVAKTLLEQGRGELALKMVLDELKIQQLTNSALRARLDRLEGHND